MSTMAAPRTGRALQQRLADLSMRTKIVASVVVAAAVAGLVATLGITALAATA